MQEEDIATDDKYRVVALRPADLFGNAVYRIFQSNEIYGTLLPSVNTLLMDNVLVVSEEDYRDKCVGTIHYPCVCTALSDLIGKLRSAGISRNKYYYISGKKRRTVCVVVITDTALKNAKCVAHLKPLYCRLEDYS
jgi:hypothetical protein